MPNIAQYRTRNSQGFQDEYDPLDLLYWKSQSASAVPLIKAHHYFFYFFSLPPIISLKYNFALRFNPYQFFLYFFKYNLALRFELFF